MDITLFRSIVIENRNTGLQALKNQRVEDNAGNLGTGRQLSSANSEWHARAE